MSTSDGKWQLDGGRRTWVGKRMSLRFGADALEERGVLLAGLCLVAVERQQV